MHHYTNDKRLCENVTARETSHLLLPGSLGRSFVQKYVETEQSTLKSIGLIWPRNHTANIARLDTPEDLSIVDITSIREFALYARTRSADAGEPGTIPLGKIRSPHGAQHGPVLLETHLRSMQEGVDSFGIKSMMGGELCVRGPMVSQQSYPRLTDTLKNTKLIHLDKNGFVRTEIGGKLAAEDHNSFVPIGDMGDVFALGGITIHAEELDSLYQGFDGASDAAAYVQSDPVLGNRLCVAIVSSGKSVNLTNDLKHYLNSVNAARHKVPHEIVETTGIPRGPGGAVRRTQLPHPT